MRLCRVLFAAMEDADFEVSKPTKLLSHPETSLVAMFNLTCPAASRDNFGHLIGVTRPLWTECSETAELGDK